MFSANVYAWAEKWDKLSLALQIPVHLILSSVATLTLAISCLIYCLYAKAVTH